MSFLLRIFTMGPLKSMSKNRLMYQWIAAWLKFPVSIFSMIQLESLIDKTETLAISMGVLRRSLKVFRSPMSWTHPIYLLHPHTHHFSLVDTVKPQEYILLLVLIPTFPKTDLYHSQRTFLRLIDPTWGNVWKYILSTLKYLTWFPLLTFLQNISSMQYLVKNLYFWVTFWRTRCNPVYQ